MRQKQICFITSAVFAVTPAATTAASDVDATISRAPKIYAPTTAGLTYVDDSAVDLPTIVGIEPPEGITARAVRVGIQGTNFVAGETTVQVMDGGVSTDFVNVFSPTQLTVTFVIDRDAATGARDVTVTTPYGVSNSVTFTVLLGRLGVWDSRTIALVHGYRVS